jgi:hypothetical protein
MNRDEEENCKGKRERERERKKITAKILILSIIRPPLRWGKTVGNLKLRKGEKF